MKRYQVIVGNVGTVEDTDLKGVAVNCFEAYALTSCLGIGREAGETVTIMGDGKVLREVVGLLRDASDNEEADTMKIAHLFCHTKKGHKYWTLTLSTSPALCDAYREISVDGIRDARRIATEHGAQCWNF